MSTNTLHQEILVGVDGSPYSDAAVRWAVGEAVMRNLQLSIVHVISPLIGGWAGVGMSGAVLPEDIGQWLEEAKHLIGDAVRIAHDSAGGAALQIRTEIPFAPVVPTLVDLSKQAQMIVVGQPRSGRVAPHPAGIGQHRADPPCALPPVAVLHGEFSPEHRLCITSTHALLIT